MTEESKQPGATRRDFLRGALAGATALAAGSAVEAEGAAAPAQAPARRPNVVMICADQFRADFIGAAGVNPSTRTPNLNALSKRGTLCRRAMSNQPLCSPSRSSFLTSRYATETGVWKLGLELDHTLPTVATSFKQAGYTTAFIGKWHVASEDHSDPAKQGWVPPGPRRGGFDDLWEGANVPEVTSHPYGGAFWDNSGTNIGFKDQYRVDFYTDRAVNFIEAQHDKPFFLFLSQLEPHHQNDVDEFVPPKRYEGKFENPHVPRDLLTLPGNWQSHLPGYYGCVQAIDDCVGRVVETLTRTGQLDNTVILFFSDHGCTFRTRMGEYKRSPHDSSLGVPFVVAGPGIARGRFVEELVSLLDLAPTLLTAAGLPLAPGMRGRAVQQLTQDSTAADKWDGTVFVQISSSMCARALRTPEWTYCVFDPGVAPDKVSHSLTYQEYALYSVQGDPEQHTNLIGRPQYREVASTLREELLRRITAAGEPLPTITPARFFL